MVTLKVVVIVFLYIFATNAKDTPRSRSLFPAIVSETQVNALLGHPVSLSCWSGFNEPIQYCQWERFPPPPHFGKRYIIAATKNYNKTELTFDEHHISACNCSYEFSSSGLDHGVCSIVINNVTDFHFNEWTCLLNGNKEHTWLGSVNISKLELKPYFLREDLFDNIVYNQSSSKKTNVTCCIDESSYVNISHSINIFVRDEVTNQTITNQKDQGDLTSLRESKICRQKTFSFFPVHGEHLLTCEVTYLYDNQEYNASTSYRLNVKFPPLLKPNNLITQRLIESGKFLEANVTFKCYPKPSLIKWSLVIDKENNSTFDISKYHVKYKTNLYTANHPNEYSASIQILQFEEKDYEREFILTLSNLYGSKEVFVRLSAPSNGMEDFYWIMILGVLGITILLSFVVVVACIILQRREKKHRGEYSLAQVQYQPRPAAE